MEFLQKCEVVEPVVEKATYFAKIKDVLYLEQLEGIKNPPTARVVFEISRGFYQGICINLNLKLDPERYTPKQRERSQAILNHILEGKGEKARPHDCIGDEHKVHLKEYMRDGKSGLYVDDVGPVQ